MIRRLTYSVVFFKLLIIFDLLINFFQSKKRTNAIKLNIISYTSICLSYKHELEREKDKIQWKTFVFENVHKNFNNDVWEFLLIEKLFELFLTPIERSGRCWGFWEKKDYCKIYLCYNKILIYLLFVIEYSKASCYQPCSFLVKNYILFQILFQILFSWVNKNNFGL